MRTKGKPWLKNWPSSIPRTINYPVVPVYWLLDRAAKKYRNQVAVIFNEEEVTYQSLNASANSFAKALLGLGLSRGTKVALFMLNAPEFITSYYGALKAGATVVTLNPLLKEKEVEYQVKESEARIMVADSRSYLTLKKAQWLPSLKSVILVGEELETEAVSFKGLVKQPAGRAPKVKINPKEDVAVIQYTAGTTATPKGVMLTHYNLVSNAIAIARTCMIKEGEVQLGALPLYHSYGMTNVMNASIYSGAKIVLLPRFEVKEALKLIERYRVNVWFGVPTMFISAVQHLETTAYDLSSLRFCNSGGGPIAPEVINRFEKLTGALLMQGYGLSEASPVTHSNIPLRSFVRKESVGKPLPDTDAKIVDLETGAKELPPSEVGELIVKGPQVMKGYWKKPWETRKALRNGWLYTGDVAKMDEDGCFYVIDRKKDIIKYKGYTVSPRELEDVLYQHPAVKECAVIGKPDPVAGEVPTAFVVLKEGMSASESELIGFVERLVAPYKKIREVRLVEGLPKSPVGKVLKRVLSDVLR